jgi:hypothetical protein
VGGFGLRRANLNFQLADEGLDVDALFAPILTHRA